MRALLFQLSFAGLLLLTACQTPLTPEPRAVVPAPEPPALDAVFHAEKLRAMDKVIGEAIHAGHLPGAVLWLEHHGVAYHQAYGKRSVLPDVEPMTEDTIFDAASLTKVMATAPAVMQLVEQGKVELDAPVARYLPAFAANGKQAVTVRHLLTHTSGLPVGLSAKPSWEGYDRGLSMIYSEKLHAVPGTTFEYCDNNFIVLAEIVHKVSGLMLDEYAKRNIFKPLGMRDTQFNPPVTLLPRIAPTTQLKEGGLVIRGIVHDPVARRMGGVAGHAGVFTTAADLARFARMFLHGGELDGVRVLKTETVELMTRVQTPPAMPDRRGLGWDIDSRYSGPRGYWFPLWHSYGHTGWTGTSVWIDPLSDTFVILLSNRNHPTEAGDVRELRKTLGTLASEAVIDLDYKRTPGGLPPTGKP